MKNLLKLATLYVEDDGIYREIEHVEDHAKRLKTTRNALNTRRLRNKLNEESIEVRGGFYFYVPGEKE